MPRKSWKNLTCRRCGERYRKCACYAMPQVETRGTAYSAPVKQLERRVLARRREAVEAALARIRGDEQVSLADRLEAQRILQPTLSERYEAQRKA